MTTGLENIVPTNGIKGMAQNVKYIVDDRVKKIIFTFIWQRYRGQCSSTGRA